MSGPPFFSVGLLQRNLSVSHQASERSGTPDAGGIPMVPSAVLTTTQHSCPDLVGVKDPSLHTLDRCHAVCGGHGGVSSCLFPPFCPRVLPGAPFRFPLPQAIPQPWAFSNLSLALGIS